MALLLQSHVTNLCSIVSTHLRILFYLDSTIVDMPKRKMKDVSGSRVTNIGSNTIDIDSDSDMEIDDDPILGNNEEDEPETTRAKAKNSSFVWDHFTKIPKPKTMHDNAIENVLEGEIIGGREKGKGRGRELGTPSSEDWNVVQMYVEILRTFYIVTERLSGSLYVTCNTFYKEVTTVKNAIAKLELSDDPKLLLLAKGMHLKFDKYRAEALNVETSKNKEKNGKRNMDLSEALDSEFDQHMEDETNMKVKIGLLLESAAGQ
ncbi:hypothetical protein Vadar_009987 [Vaccinium darrowii]|uniref:Uncharacterized protein n=1 Tax=Vaccinium darrowii TaxID=229202 RepID=A0ACB7XGI9_9ERIC|nr:hypothetical protein Vadar_009987 [Vaccinium darrowii]